jgi:hypothetical protein
MIPPMSMLELDLPCEFPHDDNVFIDDVSGAQFIDLPFA